MSTKYTVLVEDKTVAAAATKAVAIKRGTETGKPFQILSPSGAQVYSGGFDTEQQTAATTTEAAELSTPTSAAPAAPTKEKAITTTTTEKKAPAKRAAAKKTAAKPTAAKTTTKKAPAKATAAKKAAPARKAKATMCSMRGCDRAFSGTGPISNKPLCKMHHTAEWRQTPGAKEKTIFTNRRYAARKAFVTMVTTIGKGFDLSKAGSDYKKLPEGYTAEKVDAIIEKAQSFDLNLAAIAKNPAERGRPSQNDEDVAAKR